MNEIEKMYENAGVEKRVVPCPAKYHGYNCTRNNWDDEDCSCDIEVYPPFTTEKQVAIIKLISKQGQVIIENWETDNRGFNVVFRANSNLRYITMDCITRKTVEEALAQIVNDIWQDLTGNEKQQVKEILE